MKTKILKELFLDSVKKHNLEFNPSIRNVKVYINNIKNMLLNNALFNKAPFYHFADISFVYNNIEYNCSLKYNRITNSFYYDNINIIQPHKINLKNVLNKHVYEKITNMEK